MTDNPRYVIPLDRLTTVMQETGRMRVGGLSVAEVIRICDNLALNLENVILTPDGWAINAR